MKEKSIWQKDRDHMIHPYADFSRFHDSGSQLIQSGSGVYVSDDKGRQYLDGIAGLWCANIGHGRADMAATISEQVSKMQYFNPFGHCSNEPAAELAYQLAELLPGKLNHVYFTCGGSTANDAAIRIIHYYNNLRGLPNKKKIISRNDAYHGSTYISANLTGIQGTKLGFDRIGDALIDYVSAANLYRPPVGAENLSEPELAQFFCDELENRILQLGADNVAAFIAEPVMGAGGVLVAPQGYLKKMWQVCKKYDVLFIADEVVTAFGRLGEWSSSESLFEVQPDIMVLAKGINSGYIPLGAAVFSEDIYSVISQPQCPSGVFSMGFTYTGHAVACASALKNIDILKSESLLPHAASVGQYLQDKAQLLASLEIVGDVRGKGLMLAVELVADKKNKTSFPTEVGISDRIYQQCLELGVIVRPVGNTIILSPPLIITQQEIDQLISALELAIKRVTENM